MFVQQDQMYKLATKEYMRQGRDGFTCLANAKVLVRVTCNVPTSTTLEYEHAN